MDIDFSVAAPTRESQASDALLALAKMQPLSAVGMKLVTEQEIEDLKNQAIEIELKVDLLWSWVFLPVSVLLSISTLLAGTKLQLFRMKCIKPIDETRHRYNTA